MAINWIKLNQSKAISAKLCEVLIKRSPWGGDRLNKVQIRSKWVKVLILIALISTEQTTADQCPAIAECGFPCHHHNRLIFPYRCCWRVKKMKTKHGRQNKYKIFRCMQILKIDTDGREKRESYPLTSFTFCCLEQTLSFSLAAWFFLLLASESKSSRQKKERDWRERKEQV